MSILRSSAFRCYAVALGGNFAGAWLLDVTGSMLPLALSASASILCTVDLVKELRSRNAGKRGPPR